ncbi:MAG: hypothetical protein H8F28_20445 [Fibrella sp.]|nr:hypothetical protein [Armatimonadota bacterium]
MDSITTTQSNCNYCNTVSEPAPTTTDNPVHKLPTHPAIEYPNLYAALVEFANDNRDRHRGKMRGYSRPSRSNGGFAKW